MSELWGIAGRSVEDLKVHQLFESGNYPSNNPVHVRLIAWLNKKENARETLFRRYRVNVAGCVLCGYT